MYLEHFNLEQSPFQEEPDPNIFFPEAQREETCRSLLKDIVSGKPLVKLIGQEGSGKTLLCRMVIDLLPDDYDWVFIDNPIGSFDDLLRIIGLDLGMNPQGEHDEVDFLHEVRQLIERRSAENKKVVLIIDEAEKLFLATLERFIRSICDSVQSGTLRIVLSGRPGLEANLEQLSVYCSGVDINAGYTLVPLTEGETRNYLSFRLKAAGLTNDQHEDIFTDGAVAKLFESAQGNLRMINILAEESLQNSCVEKSFMVLLDHVDTAPEISGASISKYKEQVEEIFSLVKQNKILAGAGAVCFVLVLLIVIMVGGDESEPELVTEQKKERRQSVLAEKIIDEPAPAVEEKVIDQPVPVVEQEQPKLPAIEAEVTITEQVTQQVEQSRDEVKGPIEPLSVKRAAGVTSKGEKLFRERLGATAGWLAGAYRGQYTIQLMMLSSKQAKFNIEKMLVQDEYFAIKDQFYILDKKTSPPTLFVFYGSYDSMDSARKERNNMPVFLRKHHPYVLSVSDALKKTED